MSAHDQRQYRQMLYRLERVENGDLPSMLTTDLMILLDVLEASDPAWESDFGDGLIELEGDIAAAAVNAERRGTPDLSFAPETAARMQATAARMKQMVLAKIEAPAEDSQDGSIERM
jgi:hypothetical protein